MRYGAMNNPYNNLIDEIRLFGENKFDYIDLTLEKPEATPELLIRKKDEIMDALSSYNLRTVGHTPWYLELGHPYESVRKAFLKEALKIIEVLGRMEVSKTTIHPLPAFPRIYKRKKHREKIIGLTIDSIKKIVNKASEHGMIIVIENLDGGKLLSLEEYEEIIAKTMSYFHLDVGHANLDTPTNRSVEFIKHFGNQGLLKHVHISDNVGGTMKAGWDLHLPIGTGKIDFKNIFKALKEVKYNDTMTLEVFSRDRDYLILSKNKVKKFWEEANL